MLARGKISWSAEVISEVLHFKCSVITAECRNANYKTQDNTTTTTSKLTSAYISKPTLTTSFCFFIYDLWLANRLQGNKNKVKIDFLCMSYWCIMYIYSAASVYTFCITTCCIPHNPVSDWDIDIWHSWEKMFHGVWFSHLPVHIDNICNTRLIPWLWDWNFCNWFWKLQFQKKGIQSFMT